MMCDRTRIVMATHQVTRVYPELQISTQIVHTQIRDTHLRPQVRPNGTPNLSLRCPVRISSSRSLPSAWQSENRQRARRRVLSYSMSNLVSLLSTCDANCEKSFGIDEGRVTGCGRKTIWTKPMCRMYWAIEKYVESRRGQASE
jgi:hypothetical protein